MIAAARSHARLCALLIALAAWGALALQFYLSEAATLQNGGTLLGGAVLYLGYFTILTNVLVAVTASCLAVQAPSAAPATGAGALRRFLTRPAALAALAADIAFVGLSYHVLLRHVWNPQGLQLLADRMLHYAVPLLYVVFWAVCASKAGLRWSGVLGWCLYPIGYLVYALVRGEIIGSYPYPFIDVSALGYPHALRNALSLSLVFVALSLIVVALGKFVFTPQFPRMTQAKQADFVAPRQINRD